MRHSVHRGVRGHVSAWVCVQLCVCMGLKACTRKWAYVVCACGCVCVCIHREVVAGVFMCVQDCMCVGVCFLKTVYACRSVL